MRIGVYCNLCHKVSVVDINTENMDMKQYALNHGDHVIVFSVDSHGALRSVHLLRAFLSEEDAKGIVNSMETDRADPMDTFAIVHEDHVVLGVKWDSEVITIDVIPLVSELETKEDDFSLILKEIGIDDAARLLMDIIIGEEIHSAPGFEERITNFVTEIVDWCPRIINNGFREYNHESLEYLKKIIEKATSKDSIDERMYFLKKAVSILRGIFGFVEKNIGKPDADTEIKNVLSDKKDLAKLLAEGLRIKNMKKFEMFVNLLGLSLNAEA